MSKTSINYIKNSIMVGQPIIQIISYEEKRVENLIKTLFQQLKRDQTACYWDINNGLVRDNQIIKGTTDPVQALNYLIKENPVGFCVFRDINAILRDSDAVVRKLREAYRRFKNSKMTIFLLSPDEYFADATKKEIDIVIFELPDYDELADLFNRFLASMQKAGRSVHLNEEERKNFIVGVQDVDGGDPGSTRRETTGVGSFAAADVEAPLPADVREELEECGCVQVIAVRVVAGTREYRPRVRVRIPVLANPSTVHASMISEAWRL